MKAKTSNPFAIRRTKRALAAIHRYALEWADRQGWNTPQIEASFQCYDAFLIALLPVQPEEAERGTCCVLKLRREDTQEVAFLYIFHGKTRGTETFALVELTEELFMRAQVHC